MDIAAIAAIVGVGVAAAGIGITIVVLLVKGSFALGRNTAQVESLGQTVEELRSEVKEARAEARRDNEQLRAEMVAGFEKLAETIDALRVEVQQNNQMVAALPNHTHDTDGRTVFTVPPAPGR